MLPKNKNLHKNSAWLDKETKMDPKNSYGSEEQLEIITREIDQLA